MTELPPAEAQPGAPSADERNLAMAMHIATLLVLLTGGWLLNVLVPLAGMLWKREGATFLADHSREQLNFQISLMLYVVIAGLLALLTLGLGLLVIIPIGIVVGIIAIVVMIRAALAASRGEAYRFPLTLRLVS